MVKDKRPDHIKGRLASRPKLEKYPARQDPPKSNPMYDQSRDGYSTVLVHLTTTLSCTLPLSAESFGICFEPRLDEGYENYIHRNT